MPSYEELIKGMNEDSEALQAKAKENPSDLLLSIAASFDKGAKIMRESSDSPEKMGEALEIISPVGLGTLAGKASKLWKPFEAELAQKLDEIGSSASQIWKNTGTYKGPIDGMMRQEISDAGASLKPFQAVKDQVIKLGDMLEHSKLFEAYPQLKDLPVRPGKTFAFGKDSAGEALMQVDPTMLKKDPAKFLNVVLHEVQHGVQNIEGFARGGTPTQAVGTSAYKKLVEGLDTSPLKESEAGKRLLDRLADHTYRKFAGEAEARAVQARQHLDPADARNLIPTESYDVGLDQLIKNTK